MYICKVPSVLCCFTYIYTTRKKERDGRRKDGKERWREGAKKGRSDRGKEEVEGVQVDASAIIMRSLVISL